MNISKVLYTLRGTNRFLLPQFFRKSDGEPVLLEGEKGLYVQLVNSEGNPVDSVGSSSVLDPKKITLLTDKSATGPGSAESVGPYKTLRIEVWGTDTFAVQIQAIGDSGLARVLPIWDNTKGLFVDSNTITTSGFYDIDIQGYEKIQANVTAISSGGKANASGAVMD